MISGRPGKFISKLIFCMKICADPLSFIRLLTNTRRYSAQLKKNVPYRQTDETPVLYHMQFDSGKRDVFLRTRSGDIQMFYETIWEEAYEMGQTLSNGPLTILDLGAHAGTASVFFLEKYQPQKLFCVEADASNFRILKKNLAADIARATLIEAAISDHDGEQGWNNSGLSHNHQLGAKGEYPVTVRTVTMDTLMRQYEISHIDVLKVDIEGAEKQLFASTGWLSKVSRIIIEIHSDELEEMIAGILLSNGFNWKACNSSAYSKIFLAQRL
jgi:FkbM family methyltransferase